MVGVCALRGSTASVAKVAKYTICYYAATTLTAVVLGIALVNLIRPGRGEPLGEGGSTGCHGNGAKVNP
jgi:solute carrier family 1 (high affinity glutamate transporter) protein 2